MSYLNVELTGLCGRQHSSLSGVNSTRDVEKLRPAVKLLTGDYLTFDRLAWDSGGEVSPDCRFCPGLPDHPPPCDTIEHMMTQCLATSDARARIMPELFDAVTECYPENSILNSVWSFRVVTQFILDCTSFNLPNDCRFNVNDPNSLKIITTCRDLCYAVHSNRMKSIAKLKSK